MASIVVKLYHAAIYFDNSTIFRLNFLENVLKGCGDVIYGKCFFRVRSLPHAIRLPCSADLQGRQIQFMKVVGGGFLMTVVILVMVH